MRPFVITMILLVFLGIPTVAQPRDFVWVFLNTDPNRPTIPKAEAESLQAGHMANIGRLAKEGKLLVAGPFHGGGGIFVFRPTGIDSVKQWVSTDPAVKAGRFALEYLTYRPVVGSICAAGEKYTMANYTAVRLVSTTSIDAPALLHSVLASSTTADTVIAAGTFGDRGGFLVFRNKVDEARFSTLQAVTEGRVAVTARGLFIAKGSFCEERQGTDGR
ncbi:MAG: YciI family protein [Bacteroidetes bacterium]|nr:YciI family protein [Bacteroidota bacterium]